MISKNRLFSLLFLIGLFPGMIISCDWVMFADELMCLFMIVLVFLDIIENGWMAIRRQKSLLIFFSIMIGYSIYSVVFVHYNGIGPIISDMISQSKPFLPLLVVYNLKLKFESKYRPIGRILCWMNIVSMIVFWIIGRGQLVLPFGHIALLGAICLVSGCSYIYFSIDEKTGELPWRAFYSSLIMFAVGLLCGRSKYFGEFVIIVGMMFVYRPGMFRTITWQKVLAGVVCLLLMVVVAWTKIEYYFVQGVEAMLESSGSLEEMSESFARPTMYYTGYLVLLDHFPFGSGLASFGSAASAQSYSALYYEYGLDKVWGLSPSYNSFICDAYYPTLCQFGFVGVLMFILFWRGILIKLNQGDRLFAEKFRFQYVIGFILFSFVLIESIGGTIFIQVQGFLAMMLMGIICSSVSLDKDNKDVSNNHK